MISNIEKVRDLITADLARDMFKLLKNYPGHESEIVRLMTGQLGSLIAVACTDPEKALPYYAQILAHIDWESVRRDYFANTLGVDTTVPTDKPLCEVKHLDRRNPVRSKIHTGGDPREKPEDA